MAAATPAPRQPPPCHRPCHRADAGVTTEMRTKALTTTNVVRSLLFLMDASFAPGRPSRHDSTPCRGPRRRTLRGTTSARIGRRPAIIWASHADPADARLGGPALFPAGVTA